MTAATELLAFAGVMALGQFSPGPDMMLLTRTALRSGAKAGMEMALGIACGLVVHASVAVAGLALAFERMPVLRRTVCWVAAGYLLWLAWRILREAFVTASSGGVAGPRSEANGRGPFLRGLFCNLLNPKAAIFLAAVSAPFLQRRAPGLVAVRDLGHRGRAGRRAVVAVGVAAAVESAAVCATSGRRSGSTARSASCWPRLAVRLILG